MPSSKPAAAQVFDALERERNAASEARRQWLQTVDAVSHPMMVHDRELRVVRANRAYASAAGKAFRDIIGRPYWEAFPRCTGPLASCASEDELHHDDEREGEEFAVDGRTFVSKSFPIRDSGGGQWLHLFEDVTKEKAAEHQIRTLNVLYATLSAVNHAIVHSESREELCRRMVEASMESALWKGAWIGFVERETRRVMPGAWSDSLSQFISSAAVSIDASLSEGKGPAGIAIRSGRPYFSNDVMADPAAEHWRDFAGRFGVGAVASLPLIAKNAPGGVICLYAGARDIFTPQVKALVLEMADDMRFALDNLETERLRAEAEAKTVETQSLYRRSLEATIEAIAATIETRDPYTAGHQRRVADLAASIAREMGLPATAVEGIHFGALIHDLGKIQIPAELLAKPTKLTRLEFELIKTHPQAGFEIVKGISFPWRVAEMVHQHHERLDGSGYPRGLKADEIALEARILAVADVVEAMASHRPYRAGLGIEAALREIDGKRGTWFEAAAVDACVRLFRDKGYTLDKG